MRSPRELVPEDKLGVYHTVTRIKKESDALSADERQTYIELMEQYADYCGVQPVSWAVLGDRVHLLLVVPPAEKQVSLEEAMRRIAAVYEEDPTRRLKEALVRCESEEARTALLAPYTVRMGNLSWFMKGIDQRFSQWCSRQRGVGGGVWYGRYISQVVGVGEAGDPQIPAAARIYAAQVDLLPVRLRLVEDPAEYWWSSYGAALGGEGARAVKGLEWLWQMNAEEAVAAHKALLEKERDQPPLRRQLRRRRSTPTLEFGPFPEEE